VKSTDTGKKINNLDLLARLEVLFFHEGLFNDQTLSVQFGGFRFTWTL
jgi:hypothetical protein